MRLKSVDRIATVAWAPSAALLACGTLQGALDESFSTTAELEIYDLGDPGSNSLRRLGVVSGSARFNRLAWGASPDPSRSYGLLAGGMENGELDLWDPRAIIEGSGEPLVMRHSRQSGVGHSGSVKGLDFNPKDAKFLASGASDGEIFIWDLTNLSRPYSPGARSQKLEDVTALSWNRQVSHILASASNNGNTVIWDLKNKRDIITLAHPGGRKLITSVSWNPDNATQIVTACDDDSYPVLLMWDLRNASAPERILAGHSKGTLSVSWCPKDPDLIVSCGKDNRTIVWNASTSQMVGVFDVSNKWSFDVQWSSRNPDLISVASFDGKVSVHSLQSQGDTKTDPVVPSSSNPFGFDQSQTVEPKFSLAHPPKWLRRPVGCSWGFGGTLVTFTKLPGLQKSSVTITPVISEPSFARRVAELNRVRTDASTESFMRYCETMSHLNGVNVTERDREIWNFLRLMFEPGAREHIVSFLGFDRNDIGGARLSGLLKRLKLSCEEAPAAAESQPGDVFEGLANKAPSSPFALYSSFKGEEQDIDALVMKSVIVGDFESAVKICFGANRLSDALMLSLCGTQELISYAQAEYFRRSSADKSYIRVLKSVVSGDLHDVVENAQLEGTEGNWKDILALVCTYSRPEDLGTLFSTLGRRLESASSSTAPGSSYSAREEKKFAAVLCFLGAGDMGKVAEVWSAKEIEEERLLAKRSDASPRDSAQTAHVLALQSLMEKVLVFRRAIDFVDTESTSGNADSPFKFEVLYRHFVDYARCVAEQGSVDVAWGILELIPENFSMNIGGDDDGVAILKDRVFQSLRLRNSVSKEPRRPFESVLVAPSINNAVYATAPVANDGQYGNYYSQHSSSAYGGGYASQNAYQAAPQWTPPPMGYPMASEYNPSLKKPATQFVGPPPPMPTANPNGGDFNTHQYQGKAYNDPPEASSGATRAPRPPITHASPFPNSYATPSYGYGNAAPALSGYGAQTSPPSSSYSGIAPPPTTGWNSAVAPASVAAPPSGYNHPPPAAVRGISNPGAKFVPPPVPPVGGTDYNSQYNTSYGQQGTYGSQQYGAPPLQRGGSVPSAQERTQPPLSEPATSAAPPVQSRHAFGDRTHVAPSHLPIVSGVDVLVSAAKGFAHNKKKEMDDVEKKVHILIDQLNNGEVQDDIAGRLIELVNAAQAGDYVTAEKIQVDLVTTRFNSTAAWIMALKRVISVLRVEKQAQLQQQQTQHQQLPAFGVAPPRGAY